MCLGLFVLYKNFAKTVGFLYKTLAQVPHFKTRGPFLESPDNFSNPESYYPVRVTWDWLERMIRLAMSRWMLR